MPKPRPRAATGWPFVDFSPDRVLLTADAGEVRARDHRDGESFADSDLSGADLEGTFFTDCDFTAVTLSEAQLRGSRFTDVRLTATFAPILAAARTTWRNVLVENPRWGSAELFDATLDSVHIRGGKIDYLNLRNARLTNVLIEDCTITELDLGGIRGEHVALKDCRIETLDLTHASCSDVDLRTSQLSAINGLDGLKGTRIDGQQLLDMAPLLAAHLGIAVD